jgi:hypothetical protein
MEIDAILARMTEESYSAMDFSQIPVRDYNDSPSPLPNTSRPLRHQKSMVSLADSVVSTTRAFPVQLPDASPVSEVLSWMSLRDLTSQLFGRGGERMSWGRPTVSMVCDLLHSIGKWAYKMGADCGWESHSWDGSWDCSLF